jgi:hypothetical protein
MTRSPPALSRTISCASAKPASAGAVRTFSGKYIMVRCTKYISAVTPI